MPAIAEESREEDGKEKKVTLYRGSTGRVCGHLETGVSGHVPCGPVCHEPVPKLHKTLCPKKQGRNVTSVS